MRTLIVADSSFIVEGLLKNKELLASDQIVAPELVAYCLRSYKRNLEASTSFEGLRNQKCQEESPDIETAKGLEQFRVWLMLEPRQRLDINNR